MPFLVQRDGRNLGLARISHAGDRLRVLTPIARVSIFRTREEVDRAIVATNAAAMRFRGSLVSDHPAIEPILSASPFVLVEAADAFGRSKTGFKVDAPEPTQTEIPLPDEERPTEPASLELTE